MKNTEPTTAARIPAETVAQIARIIEEADRHRGAYFFTSPGGAAARRAYEREHTIPLITWQEGGHTFAAEYSVICSCRNVYARGYYTRDGEKTTLTAVKNSFKRISATAEQ